MKIYHTIQEKRDNCVGADLVSEVGDIHIKSSEAGGRYENTWSYNKKCDYMESGIHALTSIKIVGTDYVVDIIGFFRGEDLVGLYKEPINKVYTKTKTCLYREDLVGLTDIVSGKKFNG